MEQHLYSAYQLILMGILVFGLGALLTVALYEEFIWGPMRENVGKEQLRSLLLRMELSRVKHVLAEHDRNTRRSLELEEPSENPDFGERPVVVTPEQRRRGEVEHTTTTATVDTTSADPIEHILLAGDTSTQQQASSGSNIFRLFGMNKREK